MVEHQSHKLNDGSSILSSAPNGTAQGTLWKVPQITMKLKGDMAMATKIRIGNSEIHSYPSGEIYRTINVWINDELVSGVTDVNVFAGIDRRISATITFTGDIKLVGDNDV